MISRKLECFENKGKRIKRTKKRATNENLNWKCKFFYNSCTGQTVLYTL